MANESNKRRRANNAESARERAAQVRLDAAHSERRRRASIIGVSIVAVLALVAGVIAIGIHADHQGQKATTASSSVLSDIANVSPATLASVGLEGETTAVGAGSAVPQTIKDAPLTAGGKPELLFVGAEFCPYCAAERWAEITALDRFGTFTGVQQIKSSEDNLPTFTFLNADYQSKYLTFHHFEAEGQENDGTPLQVPGGAEKALWAKYTDGGFPFLYFGGRVVLTGAGYDPEVLEGKDWAQVASSLDDPSTSTAQGIDTAANQITAGICTMTKNQPESVCTSQIQQIAGGFAPYTGEGSSASSSVPGGG